MLRVGAVVCSLLLFVAAWSLPLRGEAIPDAKVRLLEDVKFLASDELEGRGVGTKGLNTAAEFIRDQFAKSGLLVDQVGGGAFQKFDLVTGTKLTEPNSLQFNGPNGEKVDLKLGEDYEVCSFGGTGPISGEVVFCGYGVDSKEDGYSDFVNIAPATPVDPNAPADALQPANRALAGKIVIFMRRTPRQSDPATAHGLMRYGDLRSKMNQAMAQQAAAVFFVNDFHSGRQAKDKRREELAKANEAVAVAAEEYIGADPAAPATAELRNKLTAAVNQLKSVRKGQENANDDALMKFGYNGHTDAKSAPPAFHISQKAANMLMAGLKTRLEDLETAIDKDLKPRSAAIPGWNVRGTLSMEKVRSDVFNVIGVIPGEGPLADETVVIGAHYDHVGRGGANSLAPGSTEIHNGADDNASGTVALLELARRFGKAAQTKKPARRIVFIAFTGEELGLLGSARYCREPVFPLEKTIAMLNMDMVGRLKNDGKLIVYGTKTSPRWEPELKQFNGEDGFKLAFEPQGFGPSDHSSFYAKKIPVLHFFTDVHSDYHRPSDDWDKLNIDGLARVVDFVERMAVATVQNPERPQYVEVKGSAQPGRSGSRPYFGAIPEFGSDEPGCPISGASPGSPADKGGLKGGDRIVKLGGNAITSLDDFDSVLRKFKPGDEVEVVVVRDKKETSLKVKLEPPRN